MRRQHALLLTVATLAVFWPALRGGFVYDDETLIAQNAPLQHGDLVALLTTPMFGGTTGYWRPLTSLLLWAGNALGGAFGIHLLALALHVGNALLARDVGERLLGAPRPAFWAALLFALHPVQAEAVGWCAAINDPLWVAFALFAMRSALGARDAGRAGVPWRVAAFGFCALLAKENGVMAVPIAWAAAGAASRTLRPFALAATAAIAAWWLLRLGVLGDAVPMPGGEPGIGASGWRAISAPAELLVRHLQTLIVPWPLSPLRPFALSVGAGVAIAWLIGALVVLTALAAIARAPGPRRAAVMLLVLPLVPTLAHFAAIGAHPIGERYLYLSTLGAALLLATAPLPGRPWLFRAIAAVFAVLSFVQTGVFHDQAAFVAHCRAHAPDDPKVLVMSGDVAMTRTPPDLATADAEYARAERVAESLAAGSRAPTGMRVLADARVGRAWCQFLQAQAKGRIPIAIVGTFQAAVDADDHNVSAWIGLGVAHGATGNAFESERAFRRALALDPGSQKAWANLAYLYKTTGNAPGLRECELHLRR